MPLLTALLSLTLASEPLAAQEAMTLQQAIELAQKQGLAARSAVSARDAARWRDRAYSARLMPQLSLTGTLPRVTRAIDPILQDDGSTRFIPQRETRSDLGMTLRQRIPFTGGELFMSSGITRVDRIGDQRTWQSTPFIVGITQDLFRPNALAWDNREQDLRAVVADREYLEAREDVALNTSNAFFDFYAARLALDNAEAKLAVNDTLFNLSKGRYEVGKIGENDLLQSELALLQARTALDGAKLDYERTHAALKRLLGLPPDAVVEVTPPAEVLLVEVDTALAVKEALRNQSRTTNLELQTVQAKRRVTEAKLNNGFGMTVSATAGFNQTATGFNEAYESLLERQQYGVEIEMPLVQWGARRAQIQTARHDEDRVAASARATREQAAEEAHFAARQLAQSSRTLSLSAKADTVAAKRFEVAKNRYLIGRIGIDNLYLAQNERDQALRSYIEALRGYWGAYYRLRRLTLYDFEEKRPIL